MEQQSQPNRASFSDTFDVTYIVCFLSKRSLIVIQKIKDVEKKETPNSEIETKVIEEKETPKSEVETKVVEEKKSKKAKK